MSQQSSFGQHSPDPRRGEEMQISPPPAQLTQPPAAAPAPEAEVTAQPVATGLAMKRRNPWLAWLVWPLITLGIYHLVWYFKIHKEMAEFDRRRSVPVAGPMLVLLFLSWTLIAPLVSYYNCGTRIAKTQHSAGLQPTCSPVLGLVLFLFALGSGTVYYQYELNRVVDVYKAEPGAQVPLFA